MFTKNLIATLHVIGVVIMLLAFIVLPDSYPWYVEVLLFDVGLLLIFIPKWPKIKAELTALFQ